MVVLALESDEGAFSAVSSSSLDSSFSLAGENSCTGLVDLIGFIEKRFNSNCEQNTLNKVFLLGRVQLLCDWGHQIVCGGDERRVAGGPVSGVRGRTRVALTGSLPSSWRAELWPPCLEPD